jgi:hypothetical protein
MMMSAEMRIVKGFRPSRCVGHDASDEVFQREKQANMAQYAIRAQAGLPLFDTMQQAIQHVKKRFK